jgi:hypothetical protein
MVHCRFVAKQFAVSAHLRIYPYKFLLRVTELALSMKRLAPTLLLLLLSITAPSQIYFRAGAVAHHYNMRAYNALVDLYNENTPGLTTKMPHQTWMAGPDFGIGKRYFQGGWEVSFRSAWGVISAEGVDTSGAGMRRDVRTAESSICAGLYLRILGQLAPLYMSFDGELSIWSNKTRVNEESYRKMDKGPTLLITPGLKYIPFKGWFTPVIHVYYACPLTQAFQEKLWQDMEPVSFADAEKKDFVVRHGHFGIGVSFLFGRQAED